MERWLGSRMSRWLIVSGAFLLASLVGLTLFRAGAEEAAPKFPAAPKTKREVLRYAGKNFEQWRLKLETELKPEVRADDMTAMAAFGTNGYAVEAARTIMNLMAGYDWDTSDDQNTAVVGAARQAISAIGKPAFPVLWDAVRGDNQRSRLFASKYLSFHETDHWHPPVADLVKVARHENIHVRDPALTLLANVENKPKSCLPVLLECMSDKEAGIRSQAIRLIDQMRPDARNVMALLKMAICDPEVEVRLLALRMAKHYAEQAKPLVPAMLKRLEKPHALVQSTYSHFGNEFEVLMNSLAAIGPAAKETLPRLRELRTEELARLPGDNCRTCRQIIDTTIKKIEAK